MSVDLNSGQYSKVYGISLTEPYFTPNGVGLTGNVTYRDQTQFVSASSDFSSETIGAGFDIGYPIGENQGMRIGLSVPEVEPAHERGRQRAPGDRLGGATTAIPTRECIDYDTDDPVRATSSLWSTEYNTVEFTTSWNYDSRNRSLFADRGMRHSFGLAYALPGSATWSTTSRATSS